MNSSKEDLLIERFCLYHKENLLLIENDWISYNDGYICIECSAIKNNTNISSITPTQYNSSKNELQLNNIKIASSPVSDNSPAYQSSSSSSESINFISLSKPYSKDFHESTLPLHYKLLAYIQDTLTGPTLTSVCFLILLGFIVACLAIAIGFVSYQSVLMRLGNQPVHSGGSFFLWLFMTILLACLAVYVSTNDFSSLEFYFNFCSTPHFLIYSWEWLKSTRYFNFLFEFIDYIYESESDVSYNTSNSYGEFVLNNVYGTGVPEVRAVLSGDNVKEVLSLRLLSVRVLGLLLASCSGLIVGPEGPFVLISAAIAHLLSLLPFFRQVSSNAYARQQLLSTAAAVGIAGVFGSPFGGLLFSIEVTSTYYPMHSYITSFLSSFSASLTFHFLWNAAFEKPLMEAFLQTNFAEAYQLFYFAIFGVICAFIGLMLQYLQGLFNSWKVKLMDEGIFVMDNTNERTLRLNQLNPLQQILTNCGVNTFLKSQYGPTLIVCVFLAFFSYPGLIGDFMALPGVSLLKDLWSSASLSSGSSILHANWNAGAGLHTNLIFLLIFRLVFLAASLNLPIPCGLVLPSMVIGSIIGRLIGEIFEDHVVAYSAGVFAVVGAAGVTASVTQSLSVIIIILEITGQIYFLAPLIVTVVISVLISRRFLLPIYQQMIKQEPKLSSSFLPPLPAWGSKASVRDIMCTKIPCIPEKCNLSAVYSLLQVYSDPIFPVVTKDYFLLGSISRSKLENLLSDFMARVHPEITSFALKRKKIDDFRNRHGLDIQSKTEDINADFNPNFKELASVVVPIPYDSVAVRLLADTSLINAHMMFISLRLQEAFVTEFGKLIGVVTRLDLCEILNLSDPVDAANAANALINNSRQRE